MNKVIICITFEHVAVTLIAAIAACVYIMWLGEGNQAWPPLANARRALIRLFHGA